jgi:hypothetical protein
VRSGICRSPVLRHLDPDPCVPPSDKPCGTRIPSVVRFHAGAGPYGLETAARLGGLGYLPLGR